jgi:hypothetical protein
MTVKDVLPNGFAWRFFDEFGRTATPTLEAYASVIKSSQTELIPRPLIGLMIRVQAKR